MIGRLTMSLPGIALDADLAAQWPQILEAQGLHVGIDTIAMEEASPGPKVKETPYIVVSDTTKVQVLQAQYNGHRKGIVHLVFFPHGDSETQLCDRIHSILIASGITAEQE